MPQHSPSSPRRAASSGRSHDTLIGRFSVVFVICSVLAVLIASFLFTTTVVHRSAWVNMGDSSLYGVKTVQPVRGEILASDGSILATNIYFYNFMMDLRSDAFKIIEFNEALPELCDSLAKYYPPYDAAKWRAKFDEQLAKPKSRRNRNFVLCAGRPKAEEARIKSFPFFRDFSRRGNTGLKSDKVLKRCYPFGKLARLSIGRTGQTTECIEVRGRSGLECALDTLLFGVPGTQVRGMSTKGTRYVVTQPAVNGYDVYTTIDVTMQDILENELGQMLLDANAEWGTAILMEVKTGYIRAMSNLELDPDSPEPRYIEALNRAVLAYEPGSVMKVMSMAVALEKGFAHPVSKQLPIGHTYNFLNRPIRDTHSPGSLPVSRFIEYSSNIGMVKLCMPHYSADPKQFKADLAEMGFFDRFNTGIAGETTPRFISDPKLIDLSRMVFGYTTAIPPLYTCAFYNAVANDGKFVRPTLVKGLRTPEGVDSMLPVQYVRERMMSSENAAILREMMHGVVWGEGGTAKTLRNNIVEIAGKTGTARIALERPKGPDGKPINDGKPWRGGYRENAYRVAFCGFFPYADPKYTCMVVISNPKGAKRGPAVSSGTVLKNVALKLYARGKLTENPEFQECPAAERTAPVVYSSFDPSRWQQLHRDLDIARTIKLRDPAPDQNSGTVPDVRGVSLREALTCLEAHGYAVDFNGVGYVYAQYPEPGQNAGPGTKVKLQLKHD